MPAQSGVLQKLWPAYGELSGIQRLVYERRVSLSFRASYAEGYPSIAKLAQSRQAKSKILPQRILSAIRQVGGHFGTALLLKATLRLPFSFSESSRREIQADPEKSRFTQDNGRFVAALLGAAGFRPLIERHDEEPEYSVHVIGQEALGKGYRESNFKLPRVAETVYPNRPIGASLFGSEKGGRMDVVCPDVVAFLVLEATDFATALGPHLFSVEQIESKLPPDAIDHLRQSHFSIQPDQTLQQTKDLGYGGIRKISILGERGEPGRPDGRKYMRLAQGRIVDDHDEAGNVLTKLDDAILTLQREQGAPLSIDRGDILLINNRRVATVWGAYTTIRRPLSFPNARPIAVGDRVLARMSFYSPEEITDHLEVPVVRQEPRIMAAVRSIFGSGQMRER